MAKTKANNTKAVESTGAGTSDGQTTIDQINDTSSDVINAGDNSGIENSGTPPENTGEQGADQGNINSEVNNGDGNVNADNNGTLPENGGEQSGTTDQSITIHEDQTVDDGLDMEFETLHEEKVHELIAEYETVSGKEFKPSDFVNALSMLISLAKGEYVIIPAKDGSENLYSEKPADTNQAIDTELAGVEDQVFASNPKLNEYFKTVDGQPFYTDAAAKNHAKGLEDKTVTKITKG